MKLKNHLQKEMAKIYNEIMPEKEIEEVFMETEYDEFFKDCLTDTTMSDLEVLEEMLRELENFMPDKGEIGDD